MIVLEGFKVYITVLEFPSSLFESLCLLSDKTCESFEEEIHSGGEGVGGAN